MPKQEVMVCSDGARILFATRCWRILCFFVLAPVGLVVAYSKGVEDANISGSLVLSGVDPGKIATHRKMV